MPDISRLVLEVDSSGVVKATGNLDIFSKATEKAERNAGTFDDVMKNMSLTAAASAGGILALYKAYTSLVSSVANFSKNAVQAYSSFEMIESGLQGVLKSAEKGTEMFEDLRKFSFDTTFGVDTLSKAATQLLNVGTSASQVKTVLLQLGNVAGGNTDKFNDLVDVYAKIQNSGKASAQQLQQLALREVPIYQYLKKIGVQGNATGKQVAKAFEEMTKEGEQFYGAMDRINETISGKEGFVSDTFREFLTSFAEASGMADLYKIALDGVYGILQDIVDWLQKVNENPVHQALLRGTLVAAVVGLTAAVGVGLVGAFKKLNAQVLKLAALTSVFNPTALAIGSAVAAIAGLTAGVISLSKSWGDAKDSKDAYFDDGTEMKSSAPSLSGIHGMDYVEELEKSIKNLQRYKNKQAVLEKQLQDAIQGRNIYNERGRYVIEGYNEQDYAYLRDVWEKLTNINIAVKSGEEGVERLKQELSEIEVSEKFKADIEAVKESLIKDFSNSEIGKAVDEFNALDEKVKSLKVLIKNKIEFLQPEDIEKVNRLLDETNKKLWEAQKAATGKSPWQKELYDVTGENADKFNTKGQGAAEAFIKKLDADEERIKEYFEFLYKNSDVAEQKYLEYRKDAIDSAIKSLVMAKDIDQPFTMQDGSIRILTKASDNAGKALEDLSEKIKDAGYDLGNFIEELIAGNANGHSIGAQIGGYALSALSSASGDVSNFVSGMQSGGLWGGVINTVIGALTNVAGELDNFDKVMNPVTDGFKRLKPVIEELFNFLEIVIDGTNSFFDAFSGIITIFKPVISAIYGIIKVLIVPLKAISLGIQALAAVLEPFTTFLNNAVNEFFGFADEFLQLGSEINDEREEEAERLRQLNEQYMNLLYAMQEMEEYYLEKRRDINATTEIGKITGVNDMILSPHGTFSTAPNDYIIATKNPQGLGKSVVNVVVNNYGNDKVSVSQDSSNNLLIEVISQKVAADYASGANGWRGAVAYQNQSKSGRKFIS